MFSAVDEPWLEAEGLGLAAGPGERPSLHLQEAPDVTEEDGCRELKPLLKRSDTLPDAIWCTGDMLALGALRALREAGREAPREVSVVGGTGLDLSETACPRLTRTRQPMEQVGMELVAMLCERIEKGHGFSLPGRVLPTPFMGGATTRPEENALLNLAPAAMEDRVMPSA